MITREQQFTFGYMFITKVTIKQNELCKPSEEKKNTLQMKDR